MGYKVRCLDNSSSGNQENVHLFVADPYLAKRIDASHAAAGLTYNIPYGEREYSIDVYRNLTPALGKYIGPHFSTPKGEDFTHSQADISKTKALLGNAPDYNFADGIKSAVKWHKNNF